MRSASISICADIVRAKATVRCADGSRLDICRGDRLGGALTSGDEGLGIDCGEIVVP